MEIPQFQQPLTSAQIDLLKVFSRSCRRSIVEMVTNAQSGHPGGSLSSIDFLATLYLFVLNQTNEPIVVSNGHISPAIYSILAELKVIPKQRVVEKFRSIDDIYEGHVNRQVPGVWYGTGPLGAGASVGAGFALAQKLKNSDKKTYLSMGDGEQQEGQVFEMLNFAKKYELNNLIMFIDYNQVQLTSSLAEIMPIDIKAIYEACGWEVLETDAHNFADIWNTLSKAQTIKNKPVCILGHSIMGQGVSFMEETGRNKQATWHGKSPSKAETEALYSGELMLSADEQKLIEDFLKEHPSQIKTPETIEAGKDCGINTGTPTVYGPQDVTDCRSAYGNALANLAELNPQILGMTADLEDSVKTGMMKKVAPERHIECGIAEQHMVSLAGGLSLNNFVPFCSTFGAFMSSRAKDQARVNDINEANVKMVATHCGLSVGEDGPTHQAIDDIGSFMGFFHTNILEPADPNQCDRIIRFISNYNGNFYVRMGRAKLSTICKEDGTAFFGADYKFQLGKADIIRTGGDVTIVASGPMVERAVKVADKLKGEFAVEVIAVSSFKPFDEETIVASAKKTGFVISIEDHNIHTGLASLVLKTLGKHNLPAKFHGLGVNEYQLSGPADDLYNKTGLTAEAMEKIIRENASS